ncbi:MAG: MaoC family dehydratase [Roseburia sp.]|nr:MaoC family dehydratase [Roseburia sp.]
MKHDFYIGQKICEEKVFTSQDVERFAQISGDCNPIHLNAEYAKKSRFGGTIVHGILLTSLISKIIGMDLPGEGSIYMEQKLKFKKPVYVGEKIIAQVVIIEIDNEKSIYTLSTDIYNLKDQCVVQGTAKVLYER